MQNFGIQIHKEGKAQCILTANKYKCANFSRENTSHGAENIILLKIAPIVIAPKNLILSWWKLVLLLITHSPKEKEKKKKSKLHKKCISHH